MRLTSRSEPGPEPVPYPGDDDIDSGVTGLLRWRRVVIRVLLVIFVALPSVSLIRHPHTARYPAFLILGTLAFVVLVDRTVLVRVTEPGRYTRWQWTMMPFLVAIAAALFAVGHMSWLTALAVASAAVGRVTPDGRATVIGLVACTGIAVGISTATGLGYSNTVVVGAVCGLGNLLAHSAERRNALMYRLKETRAELARAAVAEERLRISRDLHDLLGHSLSLIALKAELAGRLIDKDTERAAREIADLETVARRSLTEVRQAVTGYRQPNLAAELVSSRRMLASAGVQVRARVPNAYSLPPAVDALLAWTVREGATNIVRHAAARHAEIGIEVTATGAAAWLSDDGTGPGAGAEPGAELAPASGSGLAGLAERAARIGGALAAGAGKRGGFWLRVSVPLTGAPDSGPDGPANIGASNNGASNNGPANGGPANGGPAT